MNLASRLVRFLLRLLPARDRHAFAEEMARMTEQRWRSVRSGSLRAKVLFWAREVVGIGRAVSVAWVDHLVSRLPNRWHSIGVGLDARATIRSFARQPLFLSAMVLTLATGVGVNAAVTAIGWASLWKPLPYPDADRLVRIFHEQDTSFGVSFTELMRYRARSETLSGVAGWVVIGQTLDDPVEPTRLVVARVTPDLFDVLGRRPDSGRSFTANGSAREVVLSHRFWTSRYGRASSAVGSVISLDGVPHTVVGVLPAAVTYPDRAVDLFTPIDMTADRGTARGSFFLDVVARVRPDKSLATAEAEVAVVAAAMRQDAPAEYAAEPGFGGFVVPLRVAETGDGRQLLWALICGATLVLIATCLNVATLLSSRVRRRSTETRVRRWLGASRLHILRSFGVESAFVAALGGVCAVLFGAAVARAIGPSVSASPTGPVGASTATIALFVFVVTLGVAALLTVGAWATSGRGSEAVRSGSGQGRSTVRFLLVASVAQVASAIVLLSGSIVLARTVRNLVTVDLGYEIENSITVRVALPAARYPTNRDASDFFAALLDRLRERPEVTEVGLVNALPLSQAGGAGDVFVESISQDSALVVAESRIADPGYFRAMGIPLLAGRGLRPSDRAEDPRVVVVDEAFAVHFFGSSIDAIGERVRSFFTNGEWAEIVGVVGHVRHANPGVLGGPQVYVSALQRGTGGGHIVVRHRADPTRVMAVLRQELAALDPTLPLFDVQTMEGRLHHAIARERLLMSIFGSFALLALLTSSLGTYSVVRLGVDERLREIGIRRAIGAPDLTIVRAVADGGLLAIAIGVPIGLAGASWMGRILQGLVFEVPSADTVSLATAAVIVSLVGLMACVFPVRHASRTAPATLIRED